MFSRGKGGHKSSKPTAWRLAGRLKHVDRLRLMLVGCVVSADALVLGFGASVRAPAVTAESSLTAVGLQAELNWGLIGPAVIDGNAFSHTDLRGDQCWPLRIDVSFGGL
jgi:hypothetical protein